MQKPPTKRPTRRTVVITTIAFAFAGCTGDKGTNETSSEVLTDTDTPTKRPTTSSSAKTSGAPTATSSFQPGFGEIDVDIQNDIGQNNIGFHVVAYFEDSATLIVRVSDGENSAERSFEGTTTIGETQEFNDDINPPGGFEDGEMFNITFILDINGEHIDERTITKEYRE